MSLDYKDTMALFEYDHLPDDLWPTGKKFYEIAEELFDDFGAHGQGGVYVMTKLFEAQQMAIALQRMKDK